MTDTRTLVRKALRRFRDDRDGAPSVEFVIIFGPLIFLFFFTFEIALAYHWAIAAQKGAENGVRLAVTLAPVHTGIRDTNPINNGAMIVGTSATGVVGGACHLGNCEAIATVTCSGGAVAAPQCDPTTFNPIYNAVRELAYGITPEDVSVTYENVNLGFAGDAYVPLVTVRIEPRAFALNLNLFGVNTVLPGYEASLVAEDLSN